MKKENVFETDSPTIEMETQTIRRSQNGQSSQIFNGQSNNPFSGVNIQPGTPTQYSQQNGYNTFNGFPYQQNTPQAFAQQGYLQPQNTVAFNTPFNTQFATPVNPAFYNNNIPANYFGYGNPSAFAVNQPIAGSFINTPFGQTIPAPFATIAPIATNYGAFNTIQPSTAYQPTAAYQTYNSYQPAINLADGQYTMIPTQASSYATRNGYPTTSRHTNSDFISWTPTVNILETDRAFKIEVCVPGVSRENCRIHIDKNNVLRINGTRRWNQETDAVGFTKKEFNYGSFNCSFILSENMQREKISSSCRNGILIISIPKRETSDIDTQTYSEISIN